MKTHYSCAELAALKLPGCPKNRQTWHALVKREGWPFIQCRGAGGKGGTRREYSPPERIVKLIASQSKVQTDGAAARTARAIKAAVHAQAEAEKNAKTSAAFEDLWAQLSPRGREKFDARFEIVLAWRNFFAERQPLKKNESFHAFAAAYNAKHLPGIPEAARKGYPTISFRSIQRWVLENEERGLVVMADGRHRKGGGAHSTIEQHPELEKLVLGVLAEKPHISHTHLQDIINHVRIDKATGEILWPEISYSSLHRYINKWKAQNAQTHLLATNPDAWKSKYLSSLGRLDGDIVRLNQRWEMDGTPADWMLRGGRYTASVVVDVWSRRAKILFSKTPRTETNKALMRAAIFDWGVPEVAKTDNGSDYVSREMQLFFEEAGIDGVQSNKFAPWEKAHVESFIKTYLHSLLELLDAFIGHNVAERKAIQARASFAEQLFKKNAVVEVDMTVEEMQRLTDAWLEGTYHRDKHSTLGMSPFERAASWTGAVRRVDSERALDILLWKPVSRAPVISAKGIRYDKAWFIHELLPLHAGKDADIRLDPTDLGRMVVRVDGKFLCVAECPERTGIDQAAVAAKGRAIQQQWAKEERAKMRERRRGLSTDALVREIILDRAREAGKVAMLPRKAEQHVTPALAEAERAAASLAGEIGQSAVDPVLAVPPSIRPQRPEPSAKVSVVPETPELRYRLWRDLTDRFQRGEVIAIAQLEESPQLRRWLTTWPQSAEGRSLLKRYEESQKETGNPSGNGLPALIR
jgi:transposase InsO family protein